MRAIWHVRKYLRNAITKFLFHSNDHQWSEDVFGASSSRPTSDHCEKGVQEYATERTVEGQDGWKGRGRRDRSRSKHVLTLGIVRTLGGPNERLCHFYMSRLALTRAFSIRCFLLMMVANTGTHKYARAAHVTVMRYKHGYTLVYHRYALKTSFAFTRRFIRGHFE